MALVTTKEMFAKALKSDYAIGAFNVNNMEIIQGIVDAAIDCLKRAYIAGFQYKRAGVLVMDLCPDNAIQTNLIDFHAANYEKMRKVDAAVDKINRIEGRETIVLGSQQYTKKYGKGKAGHFADAIKVAGQLNF